MKGDIHNMFLNFRVHSIIIVFFYLILIGISTLSWINLMEEHTTFEETIVENGARLPSFTLCPNSNEYSNKSIESFEDVVEEIENSKKRYKIKYDEWNPTERNIVNETFNQTLNKNWYFAPTISDKNETLICLITSPFGDKKIPSDWNIRVSC